MTKIISAGIDLSKLNAVKFQTNKGTDCVLIPIGENNIKDVKGKFFLNVDIIVNDEKNEYDQDTSINIQQTKEEREAKVKRKYIGNGKTVWEGKNQQGQQQNTNNTSGSNEDELPF